MSSVGSGNLRQLIRLLVRNLGILEKSDAACCGITIAQCHAIAQIGRTGQISLVELADLLTVDKSTMSRTVNNLVDAGLVLRDLDDENRRYVAIRLSDTGRTLFHSIEEGMNQYHAEILNSIPAEKRNQVLESIELLTEAVRNNKCC